MKRCKRCGYETDEPHVELTPELKHYGRNLCPECGDFIDWAKSPHNEGKRTLSSKHSPESLGISCCELCRRPKEMLGDKQTLEVHHKDVDWTNDVPENLLILCTPCHKLTHHLKFYYYDHYASKINRERPAESNAFFALAEDF